MYDEESSAWRIRKIVRYAKEAPSYHGKRGQDEAEQKTIPISLPHVSLLDCCANST
jgi:hypothetical protein